MRKSAAFHHYSSQEIREFPIVFKYIIVNIIIDPSDTDYQRGFQVTADQKEFEGMIDIYSLDVDGQVEEVMIRCIDNTRYIPLLTRTGELLISHINQHVHVKGIVLGRDFRNNPIVHIKEMRFP